MSAEATWQARIAELEAELGALEKINRALMSRVERSTDSAGNAFSLFESNIILQQRVQERTQDLQQSNARLQAEIAEHRQTEGELRKLQRQTRLIIDTALDAVIAFDRSWHILDWNPRAEITFGYEAGFATDRLNLASLIAAGGHDQLSQYLQERAQHEGDAVYTLEMVGRHRDGHQFPMELAVSVLSGGEAPVYSAFIRDITERKLAEEARYRTLFDNSPVSLREEDYSDVKRYVEKLAGQGIADLKKYFAEFPEALTHCMSLVRIIDVNLATTRLFRARSKQHFRDHYNEALRGSAANLFVEELSGLCGGRSALEAEATLTTFDGQTLHVVINLSVAPGHRETWSKVFVSVQDMTDRKRAEDEKAKLEGQLRQAQKMDTIGTLAGGIAHDFNNMLAPILGYAEMIADATDDEAGIRDATEQIIAAARRARDLVRQILTFSRQVDQELRPVRMESVVKEALELMRASLPSTVILQTNLSSGSHVVMAEPTQVHQVILNLCTNAFQSLEQATGLIEVELRNVNVGVDLALRSSVLRQGPHICLTVRDTGSGIDRKLLHRIFEPFFTTKEVGKGTGMGLAVTHGIVQGLGGEILVESQPGRGSSFHVYLPAIDEEPAADAKPTARPVVAGCGRLLVVDDEPMVAQVTARMLERLGYSVKAMTSPVEALRLFAASPEQFDAVVTDQTMPELPGHVLAEELRRIRQGIPIVMLTGYSQIAADGDKRFTNVNEVLLKPVSAGDLSLALQRVLSEVAGRP
ncbi:MAG: PAS domain S-box protein [bacterium]|nr:PAS domain S-box protein [bacterium]